MAIPIKKTVVIWSEPLEVFGEGDSEEAALDDFFVAACELQSRLSSEKVEDLSSHLQRQLDILNQYFQAE